MKYDHRVKVNGKWFDAGVEVNATPAKKVTNEPPTKPDEKENGSNEPKYTRTKIQQMNAMKLRETATELGIEFNEEATNNELKGLILAKLEM